MTTLKLFVFALSLMLVTSCAEKTGYYNPGEESIVTNLVSNSWERIYQDNLNGQKYTTHESFVFKNDGSGHEKSVTTYDNGKTEENIAYFHWAFTTPNYAVIYIDSRGYWEIKKLTSKQLHVYETYKDPTVEISQSYKDYREYEAKALSD